MTINPVDIGAGLSVDEKRAKVLATLEQEAESLKSMVSSLVRRRFPGRPQGERCQLADDLNSEILVRASS